MADDNLSLFDPNYISNQDSFDYGNPDEWELEGTQVIPNAENFLQSAIKKSFAAGVPISRFIPTSGQELGDFPKVAAKAAGADLLKAAPPMQAIEAGSKLFGYPSLNKKMDEMLEPKTEYGKSASRDVAIAQMVVPGMEMAPIVKMGVKGLLGGAKKLFTEPGRLRSIISDIGDLGPADMKKFISGLRESTVKHFGESLNKMGGNIHSGLVSRALEEIPEQTPRLKALADEYRTMNKFLNPKEIQELTRYDGKMWKLLGEDIDLSNAFRENFVDTVTLNMPELQPLRQNYAEFFKMKDASKLLSKSMLKRVAGAGEPVGPETMRMLGGHQATLSGKGAPDILGQAITIGKQYKKAKLKRNVAVGAAGLAGLKALMSGKNPELIQSVTNLVNPVD